MATEIRYSRGHAAELVDPALPDIDQDQIFTEIFEQARPYTMTHKDTMFALYQAARYVADRGIEGDFVECGVWKGGSALLAGLTLRKFEKDGVSRRLWLYDTFDGMTLPTPVDVDLNGIAAQSYIDRYADDGKWCYAPQEPVRALFGAHGFAEDEVRFIAGDVIQTLRHTLPDSIAILRLDTDWYESTKLELETLYPKLVRGGVLIIDDYGHWAGSREAVDEYFDAQPSMLLNRINYAVRLGVKS